MILYYICKFSLVLYWAFGSGNFLDFFKMFTDIHTPYIKVLNSWFYPLHITFWHPMALTINALLFMIPVSIYINLVFGDSKTNKRKAARRQERKQGKRPILIGPHNDTDEDREEGGGEWWWNLQTKPLILQKTFPKH